MTEEVYLDNNATTHLACEARDAMCEALKNRFGNPSSEHRSGERSRRAIALARQSLSEFLKVPAERVVFGSGVTELNNWVIRSLLERDRANQLVVSEVEHSSVLEPAIIAESRGIRVARIPVDQDGVVDLAAVEKLVQSPTAMVSVQWVNNETGVIQPVHEIARICSTAGVPFHCDAAQAAGKLELDLSSLNADFVTISAHKMHGPSGVAAIVIRDQHRLSPLLFGGSQEFGLRPGTENIIGIVGFGAAAATRNKTLSIAMERMSSIRNTFEATVTAMLAEVRVNGSTIHRVCNTTNLMFSNLDGAALVALLDREGIRCSQASACYSNRPEPSHVLTAMGLTESEAFSSVRFSFSDQNTLSEVELAITKIQSVVERLTGGESTCFSDGGLVRHEV